MSVNLFDQLRTDPYYRNIAATFDSFVLRGVHVVITGVSQILLAVANGRPTVYVGYSRTGLPTDQFIPNAAFVASQPSSRPVKWGVFKLCEFDIYPRTMGEKSQYIPTFSMNASSALNTPCTPGATSVIPFKPTLLFGVQTGYIAIGAQTLVFECKVSFTIAFLGMRIYQPIAPTPPPIDTRISLSGVCLRLAPSSTVDYSCLFSEFIKNTDIAPIPLSKSDHSGLPSDADYAVLIVHLPVPEDDPQAYRLYVYSESDIGSDGKVYVSPGEYYYEFINTEGDQYYHGEYYAYLLDSLGRKLVGIYTSDDGATRDRMASMYISTETFVIKSIIYFIMFWPRYRRYQSRRGRRYRRSGYRRANGNMRAARQQRDVASVTVNKIASIAMTLVTDPVNQTTIANTAALPIWNQLRESEYFNNYAGMFDQVRVNKVRVKVTGQNTSNSAVSPTVCLAFDRNGLDFSATKIPDFQRLSTYSSANIRQWSTGNAFIMYQTIYPTTMGEKSQYIPTASLLNSPASDPASNSSFILGNVDFPVSDGSLILSPTASPSIPFKPIAFIGAMMNNVASSSPTYSLSFMVEFEFSLVFRGMRKPNIASIQGAASDYVTNIIQYRLSGSSVAHNISSMTAIASGSATVGLAQNDAVLNLIRQGSSTFVRLIANFGAPAFQAPITGPGVYAVINGVQPTSAIQLLDGEGHAWSSLTFSGDSGVQTSASVFNDSLFDFQID